MTEPKKPQEIRQAGDAEAEQPEAGRRGNGGAGKQLKKLVDNAVLM